ncbi:RHGBA protein, partial [Amia calva]|nr:RHGBA protein [Amia calva]
QVFGVPLDSLPQTSTAEYGSVPSFLLDACECLMEHVHTEGLFRKSGSVVRLKTLKTKLDQGESCIPSSLPCDVAGLLKQFFRELPEPAIPTELHEALLKAQQLLLEEERTTATQLLSCMLSDGASRALRYFFNFLKIVSQRSAENKMDSGNLAVIFAPNLLHSGDGNEKMNATTEKRLKLQAAVVHCFIENAQLFSSVPDFILEKIPAMLGVETGAATPSFESGECETEVSGVKRRRRRSVGDMVNGALHKLKTNRTPTHTPQPDGPVGSSVTPVILTPNSKRKLPTDAPQSFGFSNKKRRSLKHNLALELLPNILFGGGSTPNSGLYNDGSPCTSLDSAQSAVSSAGGSRQPASSAKRRSKRFDYKKVNRVESGKTGCFSPRVSRKEAARKSLRLRFSLGKNSSRDLTVISNSFPAPKGSENIGWRLATQESDTSFESSKDTAFSPVIIRNKCTRKGSKYMSKSEENLLTPQCDVVAHRTSWNGASPVDPPLFGNESCSETPMGRYLNNNYYSEPALVSGKPPIIASIPKTFCSSNAESLQYNSSFTEDENTVTGTTVLKIKKAFTESGSDLRSLIEVSSSSGKKTLSNDCENVTNDTLTLLTETCFKNTALNEKESSLCISTKKDVVKNPELMFAERDLVKLPPLLVSSDISAPDQSLFPQKEEQAVFHCNNSADVCAVSGNAGTLKSQVIEAFDISMGVTPENINIRVADHIQRFNVLSLTDHTPKPKRVKSPLKFQRTPVRQSVRRINSMLGERTRGINCPTKVGSPMVKSVSHESGLSSNSLHYLQMPENPKPRLDTAEPKSDSTSQNEPKQQPNSRISFLHPLKPSALGDVTNKIPQKSKGDGNSRAQTNPEKSVLHQITEKDKSRYKGSPKNPLPEGRLRYATRPIDL